MENQNEAGDNDENWWKRRNADLKIAGYCNPILNMEKDELVNVLNSFIAGEYKMTVFVSDKEVEVIDMPTLVLEIGQIEQGLIKIEEWYDPVTRTLTIQQHNLQPQRRNSASRSETNDRDVSYKN